MQKDDHGLRPIITACFLISLESEHPGRHQDGKNRNAHQVEAVDSTAAVVHYIVAIPVAISVLVAAIIIRAAAYAASCHRLGEIVLSFGVSWTVAFVAESIILIDRAQRLWGASANVVRARLPHLLFSAVVDVVWRPA